MRTLTTVNGSRCSHIFTDSKRARKHTHTSVFIIDNTEREKGGDGRGARPTKSDKQLTEPQTYTSLFLLSALAVSESRNKTNPQTRH